MYVAGHSLILIEINSHKNLRIFYIKILCMFLHTEVIVT